MAESKSNVLYKGFTWGNYHTQTKQWTKSIYDEDVEFVRTENFTYQCNTDKDYENHLVKERTRYAEPKITLLVDEGVKCDERL